MHKYIFISMLLIAKQLSIFGTEMYQYFSSEAGLSNSTVSAITVDSAGYMWFGTLNGLNRYDGTTFTSFYYNSLDSTSVAGNEIKCLYVDSLSNIWVGTSQGLSLYDLETESFVSFKHSVHNPHTLSQNNISQLMGDKTDLWISTSSGLNKLNLTTKRITRYYSEQLQTKSDEIQDFALDGKRGIWIAHYSDGLDYYNRVDSSVVHFNALNTNTNILPSNEIESLLIRGDSSLWVGMETGELVRLKHTEDLHFEVQPIDYGLINATIISIVEANGKVVICTDQNGFSVLSESGYKLCNISTGHQLSNDKIWSAYEDEAGTLWLGHFRGGVSVSFPKYSHRVKSYSIDSEFSNAQIVTSISEYTNGEFLIGTDGVGLFTFNYTTGESQPILKNALGKSAVLTIKNTEKGSVLCGTYADGIYKLNHKLEVLLEYKADVYNPSFGPSGNDIRGFVDRKDELWFIEHSNYLNRYDKKTGIFEHFSLDFVDSIHGNVYPSPWCMSEIDSMSLAIGTNRGLFIYDIKTNVFRKIVRSRLNESKPFSNSIRELYLLSNDTLLIGSEGGLSVVVLTDDEYTFSEPTVLTENHICAIEVAESGGLWISTKSGLCKVDRGLSHVLWFDKSDGVSSNEFVETSSSTAINGQLLFGCNKGIVSVEPESLLLNTTPPKVVLSDLLLNYNKETIHGSEVLSKTLNLTSQVKIPFSYKAIGFTFSSLNFIQNHKNEYSVFLEGFDSKWRDYSKNTSVSYTNLEPGNYTFKVKTRNNDGVESEVKSVEIIIVPPYYKTLWFQLLILCVAILGLFGVYKVRTGQIRRKNEFLQNHNLLLSKEIVERKHAEQELISSKEIAESANKAKSEFLANMSHEIRTPLNAVHGFCEILSMTNISDEQNKYVNSIKIASDGLLTLINDLLDLSKIEAGQVEIKSRPIQIKHFLQEVTGIFDLLSKQKGLSLQLTIDPKLPNVIEIDMTRLRQVLVNLLGNALKFTHEGAVAVEATLVKFTEDTCDFSIDITDTGIGVEEANLNKIFDSFSQIESSSSRKYEGTGLGLAICKKMVELMNGQIAVSSIIGKGSTFSTLFKSVKICTEEQLVDQESELQETVSKRAYILSPLYEHLETLSEVLLSLSYDVSVFNIDDKDYVESQATQEDIILVFGDENIESYDIKLFRRVAGVVLGQHTRVDASMPLISPPFSIDTLTHMLDEFSYYNDDQVSKESMLENSDIVFMRSWLERIAPYVEVYDTQEVSVLAKELCDKGDATGKAEFTSIGKELLEAVEMFELNKISACVSKLKRLSGDNE